MMNGRTTSDKLVIFGSIAALLVALVACIFLTNLVLNFATAFIPLFTGALLLLGNRTAVFELFRTRTPSLPVFNAMIGVSLILIGLGTAFFGGTWLRVVLYAPAIAMLLAALPIALSKPAMFSTYKAWWDKSTGAFRRVKNNYNRPSMVQGQFNPQTGQPTIQLDPNDVQQTANQPRR